MSIDEYLQIEQERGKFISGGGYVISISLPPSTELTCIVKRSPQSEAEPTSSEQLAIDAEQDGTAYGEDKAEQKRLKDENWSRYTEANPKGAGNTMNRG